jgi:hypothetical protein
MLPQQSNLNLSKRMNSLIHSWIMNAGVRLINKTECLSPARFLFRTRHLIILAVIPWLPVGCSDQPPAVDRKTQAPAVVSAGPETVAVDQDQQAPVRQESDTSHSESPEKLVAAFEDLEMYEDEFYIRLNYNMIFDEIQSLEQFKKANYTYETIKKAMWDKVCRTEAESNGAHDDPGFMAYKKYSRASFFHLLGTKALKQTLPPPEPIDSTPPDEYELREKFDIWQREWVRYEPIWVHYIIFQKKEGDPAGNETRRLEAAKALDRVREGENFVDVKMEMTDAKEPSRDPWVFERSNDTMKPLRKILEIMQPGEMTDVIERPDAYYIFHVLPGQEWTDLSSYEKVQSDPRLAQKLADFIVGLRLKTNPLEIFIEEQLAQEAGYEEYDPTPLDDWQVPLPETILVRLDDLSWTMQELSVFETFIDLTREDPLEKEDVVNSIKSMRSYFLISTMVDRGEIEIEEKWFKIWPILETRDYEKWLRQSLGRVLLEQSRDLPEEGQLTYDDSRILAQEIRDRLAGDFSQRGQIHLGPEDIDWDRVEFYVKPPDRFAKPDFKPPVPDQDF